MSERAVVALLTTGRQDYGLLRSTIRGLSADSRFELLVYAGGMHCSPRFGRTVDLVRADGCAVHRELAFLADAPDPVHDTGNAVSLVGDALRRDRPAALILAGDRSETLAAGLAATLERVAIIHLHGGEESEGAVDNAFRHALTKLSHLHLVSHDDHRRRVVQMGEPPENVIVVGAPGLDHLYRDDLISSERMSEALGAPIERPLILVTVHPTTLGDTPDATAEARAVAGALDALGGTVVISQPNADAGGATIRAFWTEWAASRPHVVLRDALGDALYWGLLHEADVLVGNSSSGIIEAPAAGLPSVNVGDRQRGRLRATGTLDAPPTAPAVAAAISTAMSPGHRAAMRTSPPLYPPGPTAPRIIEAIAEWLPRKQLRKVFRDLAP